MSLSQSFRAELTCPCPQVILSEVTSEWLSLSGGREGGVRQVFGGIGGCSFLFGASPGDSGWLFRGGGLGIAFVDILFLYWTDSKIPGVAQSSLLQRKSAQLPLRSLT